MSKKTSTERLPESQNQGRSQTPCFIYSTLTASESPSEKVSDMLRHNSLLLQGLAAACCSTFGPFCQRSNCLARTLPGHRHLWALLPRPTVSRGGASLTCMSWSQQNHVPLKKNNKITDYWMKSRNMCAPFSSTLSKTFSGLTALQCVGKKQH